LGLLPWLDEGPFHLPGQAVSFAIAAAWVAPSASEAGTIHLAAWVICAAGSRSSSNLHRKSAVYTHDVYDSRTLSLRGGDGKIERFASKA